MKKNLVTYSTAKNAKTQVILSYILQGNAILASELLCLLILCNLIVTIDYCYMFIVK